jgi:general secretion pathway protein C
MNSSHKNSYRYQRWVFHLLLNFAKIKVEVHPRQRYSAPVYRAQMGFVGALLVVKAAIALSLVFWIAISLSSIFWRFFPQPELISIVVPANANAFSPTKIQTIIDIDELKSLALFGKESSEVPVIVAEDIEVVEQVEETRLNLKLVGSFANTDKNLGYAIIAKGRDQSLYQVGDKIADLSNVELIGVYSEKVILNNKGRQEALYMFTQGESNISAAVSSRQVITNNTQSLPAISPRINADQRLQKISDVIRFSRKTKGGRMLGFRVLPGRNRQAFDQTGLQLNDVVTAIDGQALDNLQAANSIYQEKRAATQASLSVLRGQQELTIDINLNNINLN